LYDLNYDGTYFQLGGGVGASKAFERYSFEASVGQTVFPLAHTIGSTIVLRNGREITDYLSDGQKITFKAPCSLGEAVEILAFSSFQAANSYTKAETQALLNTASALPVGTMLPFPRGTVPAGFLEVDGSTQSASVYPDLAAYLGGAFNKGNEPQGFFRLPDTRGEFLRGWDHGRGVDPGRAVGSWAGDSLLDHQHAVISADAGTGKMPFEANVAGSATGNLGATARTAGSSVLLATLVSGVFAPAAARGGTETRPRSLAVMWCLKAWNAPVNQGQIDVAALVAELTALRSSTPVGAILPFPKAEVPAGYLELDGSLQSMVSYPDLATYLGTTYNTGGEPAGYFRLPDYRGEFLRGWDHGRGVDAGRNIGSQQTGSLQTLDSTNVTPTVTGLFNATITPESSARAAFGLDPANPVNFPSVSYSGVTGTAGTLAAEGQNFGVTRPRNLSVMWCIKAWNAPVNQGNINVAALAPLAGQATESNLGTIKLATQAEVNAGVVDSVAVTPKKLRWGFAMSFGVNGYIIFPSWLGGLIIQYGSSANTTESVDVSFPVAFPNRCVWVAATDYTPANGTTRAYWQFRDLKSTGLNALNQGSFTKGSTGWGNPTLSACPYFAIGY
jgi:microcystin-dependent protein